MEDYKQVLAGALNKNALTANDLEAGASRERVQMLERLSYFGEKADSLKKRDSALVDFAIYGTSQPATGATVINIFTSQMVKTQNGGYNSIANGKADKDFLLQSIMVEYADGAANTFVAAEPINALKLGRIEAKTGGLTFLELPMHVFNKPDEFLGESAKTKALMYTLKNPKIIRKDEDLVFDIFLAGALPAATTGHYVRVTYIGIAIASNKVQ